MSRALRLAVRFHEGRYHGHADRFHAADGWPPSPGRLFQALVAAAARGARLLADDRRALGWLEQLDPPRIAAPPARRGDSVKLFVPNNDLDAVGGDPDRVSEIRTDKQWQPCFFDPDQPVVYVWNFDSGEPEAERVSSIAARLYQLGRGVDMACAVADILPRERADAALADYNGALYIPGGGGDVACPHPGTLASLVERHEQARGRLTWNASEDKVRQLFTQPPRASFGSVDYRAPARLLHFELRDGSAFTPRPLRLAAPLIAGLRDGAVAKLRTALPAQAALFEKLIVGRGAGPDDLDRRIRMLPLPSIGAAHADLSIRRVMIAVPAQCPVRVDDLRWAFAGLSPCNPETGEVWPGRLVSTEDSRMADRFSLYGPTFHSVTAVALSNAVRRRLGAETNSIKDAGERLREEARAVGAVVQALRHAGVRARPTDIRVQREPFQRRGAMAERFAAGSRFSKHALWHVELQFREAIPGPLLIGDGRFCGLGVMVPTTTGPVAQTRRTSAGDAAPSER